MCTVLCTWTHEYACLGSQAVSNHLLKRVVVCVCACVCVWLGHVCDLLVNGDIRC